MGESALIGETRGMESIGFGSKCQIPMSSNSFLSIFFGVPFRVARECCTNHRLAAHSFHKPRSCMIFLAIAFFAN